MFLVLLTYTAPLDEVDKVVAEHREFLDRQYSAGHFVFSGPRIPRTGGLILARVSERRHLDEILSGDPFKKLNLAKYEVFEFEPNKADPALSKVAGFERIVG